MTSDVATGRWHRPMSRRLLINKTPVPSHIRIFIEWPLLLTNTNNAQLRGSSALCREPIHLGVRIPCACRRVQVPGIRDGYLCGRGAGRVTFAQQSQKYFSLSNSICVRHSEACGDLGKFGTECPCSGYDRNRLLQKPTGSSRAGPRYETAEPQHADCSNLTFVTPLQIVRHRCPIFEN